MSTPAQQTTQTRADGKTKPTLETAPEPIDDGEVVVDGAEEGAEQPREHVAVEEQPQRARPEYFKDDARERIAKLYREQRDAEERALAEPAAEEGAEPPAEAQDAAPAAEPVSSPGQQQIKIVVDGREEFLPLDEVVRRAQISSATESRLEEAKRLLKEAKEMRAAPAHQPAPAATPQQGAERPISQPDQQPAEHQRGEALDPEKLGGIVERIQVGDKDEGAQALAEYTDEIERRVEQRLAERLKQANVDPSDLDRRIDARNALNQTEADMQAAARRFGEKYPEIVSDHDLGVTGLGILARQLVDEIKTHSDLTDEQLAPYRLDVRQLAHAAAHLKRSGRPIRGFDELLEATGKVMADKYGFTARGTQANAAQPQPQPARNVRIGTDAEIAARNERKRTMPSQPRPAGVRTPAAPAQPQPKTAAQIVAEQRRARGFPVNG